jgi:hypothetical protein
LKGTFYPFSALLLFGCSQHQPPVSCPDLTAVVPASLGGAKAVAGLTARLAGPDRENVIDETATRFRRQDPAITNDTIINIMIAADCPNVIAKGVPDARAERARIATIRNQVVRIIK